MFIWIKVISNLKKKDVVHDYTVSTTEQFVSDEEDGQLLNFEVSDNLDKIYVLFQYFENYINESFVYESLDAAQIDFNEKTKDQTMYNESEFHVIEKSFGGDLQSTVYVKNNWGEYEWPDKGIRWVLKTIRVYDECN
jgi:hypothetical protein